MTGELLQVCSGNVWVVFWAVQSCTCFGAMMFCPLACSVSYTAGEHGAEEPGMSVPTDRSLSDLMAGTKVIPWAPGMFDQMLAQDATCFLKDYAMA